jgi:hypothetical protein
MDGSFHPIADLKKLISEAKNGRLKAVARRAA